MKKIAIIGAGLAGLTFASRIKGKAEITLFEKSRGIGGRMATRYAGDYEFDHGAQYFTAKGKDFQAFLEPFIMEGVVCDWNPKLVTITPSGIKPRISNHPSYVAVPRMNGLAKHIVQGLEVIGETQIEKPCGEAGNWQLTDLSGKDHGPFDWVVFAIPCHQAIERLPEGTAFKNTLEASKMDACFSLMLGFQEAFDPGFDGAFVEDSAIGWMSVNSSKPDRPKGFSMMVQSHNQWAEEHVDDDRESVMQHLLKEASSLTGHDLTGADHKVLHRWLYASTNTPAGASYLLDETKQIACIGDWCIRGRVEAAFESGFALAGKLEDVL